MKQYIVTCICFRPCMTSIIYIPSCAVFPLCLTPSALTIPGPHVVHYYNDTLMSTVLKSERVKGSADPHVAKQTRDELRFTCVLSILHSFCRDTLTCLSFPFLSSFCHQDGGRPPPVGQGCWVSHTLHSGWLGAGCAERQVLYSHLWRVRCCLYDRFTFLSLSIIQI